MYFYIYTAFTMIKAQFDYSLGNLQSFFVYIAQNRMLQEELYHKSSLKIANIPGFSIPVIF